MNGIVLELQQDLLSKDCDILNALRKAHIIATKLKLSEFDSWIQKELNGYKSENETPEYRRVKGTLKALNPYNGWIPVGIGNSTIEKSICQRKLCDSISAIIELCTNNDSDDMQLSIPGELVNLLNKNSNLSIDTQFTLVVGIHYIKEIIEHVKDCLLQWTLKLEESDIVGNDLTFTIREKENAQTIPQTINNYYGTTNVIAAPTSNTQIAVGNNNNISFDYGSGKSVVSEIKKSIENENISQENKDDAKELLVEIENKIKKKKKPNIIKAAFVALKDFLISVGAGLTVTLIEAKMNGLF